MANIDVEDKNNITMEVTARCGKCDRELEWSSPMGTGECPEHGQTGNIIYYLTDDELTYEVYPEELRQVFMHETTCKELLSDKQGG